MYFRLTEPVPHKPISAFLLFQDQYAKIFVTMDYELRDSEYSGKKNELPVSESLTQM